MERNREVTWNTSTIQAFLHFSRNILFMVFFPSVPLLQPSEWNEPGFRAAHNRYVKNPDEKTHENCFEGMVIRKLIAIKIIFCSFLNQKLIQLLPLRRKHCRMSSLPFSLPQFSGDHSRPKAPPGCFSCFDSELEQPRSHHCGSKFPKDNQPWASWHQGWGGTTCTGKRHEDTLSWQVTGWWPLKAPCLLQAPAEATCSNFKLSQLIQAWVNRGRCSHQPQP